MSTDSNYHNFIRLFNLMTSFWIPQALSAVVKLGVADAIGDGSVTTEALSRKLEINPESLYRLLRALSPFEIFVEEDNRTFRLAALGQLLRSDRPDSLKHAVLMYSKEIYQSWSSFTDVVSTNSPSWAKHFQLPYFEYLGATPESQADFNNAMKELGATIYADSLIQRSYPLPSDSTVIDVGGGKGGLLKTMVEGGTRLKGVLYDLAHVVEAIRQELVSSKFSESIQLSAGDFFKSVPSGGDLYLLKRVLHDWPDLQATQLLQRCREAMKPGAKLIVIEYLIPEANIGSPAHFMDLHMMTILGGRERTLSEFKVLLEKAGLKFTRSIDTGGLLGLVEAVSD